MERHLRYYILTDKEVWTKIHRVIQHFTFEVQQNLQLSNYNSTMKHHLWG